MNEEQLAECCKALLTRLQRPVQQALHDAHFALHELDHILLVGGATRMPLVRQTVARLFGRFPRYDLNPDEAMALDAETVNTAEDNQTHVMLKIYQGEGCKVQDNVFLGEMRIDVPPRLAGEVLLDVRFTYTLDGLLEVECHSQGSPTVSRLVIEKVPGQMSEEQIAESLLRLADLKKHPRDRPENQALLARCSHLYERLLGEERNWLDHLLTAFEQALESQDLRRIAAMRQQVEQFLERYEAGDML